VRYLALLRGINVGGRNKVEMSRLAAMFETIGSTGVRTYINSGNVIFDNDLPPAPLHTALEDAILADLGFEVRLVLRTADEFTALAASIPPTWTEDATMRCYVMFLWDDIDDPTVVDRLTIKDRIDDVTYQPGAIVWRVDRDVLTRSGMMRLTKDDLYQRMTIRNVNTVRKLAHMINEL
jgi:uncharacterized protein (DUF1697 family)